MTPIEAKEAPVDGPPEGSGFTHDGTTGNTGRDIRTFADTLGEIEDGALHAELTDTLRDLVSTMHRQAATTGGKPKGKLTLALNLTLDGGVFEVVSDIAVTLPKAPRVRSIFYRGTDDTLSVRNPRQLGFDLPTRDATAGARPSAPRIA